MGKAQLASRNEWEKSLREKKIFSQVPGETMSQEELEKMYNLCMTGSEAPEVIILDGVFITRQTLKIPEIASWFENRLREIHLVREEKERNRKKFLEGLKNPYGFWKRQTYGDER